MLIENSFRVPVPVEQAWNTLLDVPRIASCLSGATLEKSEGATHRGLVTLKVGPIRPAYRGEASIAEQDESIRRLVLLAQGKETRGSGAASARVVADLVDRDGSTDVRVATELDLTGKPAQFGRSIITDVSGRLIDQFATNLAALMVASEPAPDASVPSPTTASPAVAAPTLTIPTAPPEGAALDVWTLMPVTVRVALRTGVPALLLVGLGWLLGRRGR